MVEHAALLKSLGKALHVRFPDISALFLFGSQARGNACETSDVDLAIFTAPGMPLEPRLELSWHAFVTTFLHTDQVDLVWLNRAKLLLQWEVVRTGTLLFCTDIVAVSEYIEGVEREARDVVYFSQLCQAWYRTFLAQAYLQKGKRVMLDLRRLTEKIDYIRNTSRPALEQLAALDTERFAADPIALGAARGPT